MNKNARTFTISDVITISREVRVLKRCPTCKTDLTKDDALKLWEYQDQSRTFSIQADGTVEWSGYVNGGESTVALALFCANCDHTIGAGEELTLDGALMPAAADELIKMLKTAKELARAR